MAAVGEAAPSEELGDVLERLLEPLVGDPQLDLAHPGRVDHEGAPGKLDELPARRRVAPLAVVADLARLEELLAEERVDERRLADSGGAEQSSRDARTEVRAERVESCARHVRDRNDGNTERDGLDLRDHCVDVVGEIGLGEDEHRLRSALPREREVALEAPEVHVLVDRGDDEHDVDVGGEHLLLRRLPGGLPRELRVAGEDGLDRPALLVRAGRDGDPVAYRREVGGRRSVVEAPGDVHPELAELGEDVVGAAMLHGHTAGGQSGVGVGLELLGAGVVPAERGEV